MPAFLVGHAAHPDWRRALALAAAQVDAQQARHDASAEGPLTLGFVYFSDHYVAQAEALHAALGLRWPGVSWVGCAAVGVAAGGVEYIDQPALVLMLAALPRGRFEVYSGARRPGRIEAFSALVHADPATPDLAELIAEMSDRTSSGYLFGGLVSSRGAGAHLADGVWRGGLSGVAFSSEVALVSRVTQGSQPVGPTRTVTACDGPLALTLDGEPALACLLRDLGLDGPHGLRAALPQVRATLAGLTDAGDAALAARGPRQFGPDTRVRHLVGLDPARQAVAVAERLETGLRLAFCQRDVQAARRDLVRICSEIRDEAESLPEARVPALGGPAEARRRIRGALYISCAGRGGPHFGGPSAELKIVQHALGDVPLVGFFAGGEVARHHLYGYTGVLTAFTRGPDEAG
ncbi:MAG: FIST C-terminal domain-containing protein [Burkholderiales bacterium]|nr:FIST C-terminal domain-containing protein [Burkholderiales bacterium]MDE2567104.1 FIST C-terminal domain-containing protein [Burkholderiales bacterium]